MGQTITNSNKARRPRRYWWRVLLTAAILYVVGLTILALTGNPNLFPTVVLIGSFMVPATFVAFLYGHRHLSKLSVPTAALAFFYGGVLGVFAAAVLEPLFVQRLNFLTAFQIGLIEEFAKILGVLVIARRVRHDSELDGLILGAAAGMGFAALESMGYAFTAFLASRGSLSATVVVTLFRAILSPLGHGAWTAILAGILFRESRNGRFRINRPVIAAYLGVSILHGLWDGLPGFLSQFVSSGLDIVLAEALVGATGLFMLWWRWREARRLQEAEFLQRAESGLAPAPSPGAPVASLTGDDGFGDGISGDGVAGDEVARAGEGNQASARDGLKPPSADGVG